MKRKIRHLKKIWLMAASCCELSTVKQHFPFKVCLNGPVKPVLLPARQPGRN